MSSLPSARPAREELLRALGPALGRMEPALEVIARRLLGLEARIDLVCHDAHGQVVLVSVADAGQDLARLADALAQRSWVEPRIADWLQLAPRLPVDPALGVRLLLLAPRFEARTLAAARALGPQIELGLYRWDRGPDGLEVRIEGDGGEPARAVELPLAGDPEARFRTGLRDEDLGLPGLD